MTHLALQALVVFWRIVLHLLEHVEVLVHLALQCLQGVGLGCWRHIGRSRVGRENHLGFFRCRFLRAPVVLAAIETKSGCGQYRES